MTVEIGTLASAFFAAIARHFFAGGFVQRHVLHGRLESGDVFAAPVCLVVHVSKGRIERLFEYLDPATVRAAFARGPG